MLQRFEHLNIKEANTSFDRSIKLGENTGRAIAQLENTSAIGSMMYAMHCTLCIVQDQTYDFQWANFLNLQIIEVWIT